MRTSALTQIPRRQPEKAGGAGAIDPRAGGALFAGQVLWIWKLLKSRAWVEGFLRYL